MFFNTEALTAAAKLSEFFPTGQSTFKDPDDLISFANQELMIKLVPVVMSVRQDFFTAASFASLKVNLNHYAVPERAIGNAFQDLFYVPDPTQPLTRYSLSKLSIHDAQAAINASGQPSGFYMRGDEAVLNSTLSSFPGTPALLWSYYRRPNRLVPTSSCAKITAITPSGTQTVFTVDTDLTASALPQAVGMRLDVLSYTSPFRLWAMDSVIQAITSTQITLNTADVQDESLTVTPQVGDYICPAQTANVPMLPQELHPILSEMIAFRCNKALSNQAGMAACAQNIKDMMEGAMTLIANRVDDEVDVVCDAQGFMNALPFTGHQIMTR